MIFVAKTEQQEINPNQKVKIIDSDVGGCCCCLTTNCKTKVTFEKKMYYLGQTAKV